MSSDTSCQNRQKQGSSLKTVMGTLLFRNVVTPACRQVPGHPSLSSLHGRAGLCQKIWLTAYVFMTIFFSNYYGSGSNTEVLEFGMNYKKVRIRARSERIFKV